MAIMKKVIDFLKIKDKFQDCSTRQQLPGNPTSEDYVIQQQIAADLAEDDEVKTADHKDAAKASKIKTQSQNDPSEPTEDVPPSSKRNPRSSEKEIADGIASVEAEMAKTAEAIKPEYVYPPIDLLKKGKSSGKCCSVSSK